MAMTVDQWFAETNNPMAGVMQAVRAIILEDEDITETVKYRAPAFEYDGIMCYFNWSAKKRASLIFPSGRSIPGEFEHFEDGSNLQRMMYFDSLDDVAAKADALRDVVGAYVFQHS